MLHFNRELLVGIDPYLSSNLTYQSVLAILALKLRNRLGVQVVHDHAGRHRAGIRIFIK
jgi:hypothetical protein